MFSFGARNLWRKCSSTLRQIFNSGQPDTKAGNKIYNCVFKSVWMFNFQQKLEKLSDSSCLPLTAVVWDLKDKIWDFLVRRSNTEADVNGLPFLSAQSISIWRNENETHMFSCMHSWWRLSHLPVLVNDEDWAYTGVLLHMTLLRQSPCVIHCVMAT